MGITSSKKYAVPAIDIVVSIKKARELKCDNKIIDDFLNCVPGTATYNIGYRFLVYGGSTNGYYIQTRYTEHMSVMRDDFKILHYISCNDFKNDDCIGLTEKTYNLYQKILNFINPNEKIMYLEPIYQHN